MSEIKIEEEELRILKIKSAKFDEISNKIDSFYDGDEDSSESEAGLDDIGEWVSSYLGYI